MSLSCIEKWKSSKSFKCAVLSLYIETYGIEMMLYSYCFKNNLVCKMVEGKLQCSNCICYSRSYNGISVASLYKWVKFLTSLYLADNASILHVSKITEGGKRED